MRPVLALLLAALPAAGCATRGPAATARLTGDATYRDATTTTAGEPHHAAAPPAQAMTITVEIDEHGASPDRRCAADPPGASAARYTGSGELASDGTYAAVLASGPGASAAPAGCPPGAVTGARLHAELAPSAANCDSFCAANARADAESQCHASADPVSCRAAARLALASQCQATCTTRAHAIAADAELGAAAFGGRTPLEAAELDNLQASLVFDHLTDASGARL